MYYFSIWKFYVANLALAFDRPVILALSNTAVPTFLAQNRLHLKCCLLSQNKTYLILTASILPVLEKAGKNKADLALERQRYSFRASDIKKTLT